MEEIVDELIYTPELAAKRRGTFDCAVQYFNRESWDGGEVTTEFALGNEFV
jgi:hypothetical protein